MLQVVGGGELAGRVAREREGRFVGGDAVTVVRDAQEALPALAQLDADLGGPSVEAVFEQFFGDIGRAFDNFARRDLGRDIRRQHVNGHNGDYSIGQPGRQVSSPRHLRMCDEKQTIRAARWLPGWRIA